MRCTPGNCVRMSHASLRLSETQSWLFRRLLKSPCPAALPPCPGTRSLRAHSVRSPCCPSPFLQDDETRAVLRFTPVAAPVKATVS
jgi:hypothetical protein